MFELVPDATLAGAAGFTEKWLLVFAGLYIWMKIWKAATIELQESDALILYVLWQNRDSRNKISEELAFLKLTETARRAQS